MDAYNDADRLKQLMSLAKEKFGEEVDEAVYVKILSEENKMTQNKEYLVALNEAGIIDDQTLGENLNECFESFITEVAKLIGDESCLHLYGYSSGQKIEIISVDKLVENPPRKDLQEITVSLDGTEEIEELYAQLEGNNNILLKTFKSPAMPGLMATGRVRPKQRGLMGKWGRVKIKSNNKIMRVKRPTIETRRRARMRILSHEKPTWYGKRRRVQQEALNIQLSPCTAGAREAMVSVVSHWVSKNKGKAIDVSSVKKRASFPKNRKKTEGEVRSIINRL